MKPIPPEDIEDAPWPEDEPLPEFAWAPCVAAMTPDRLESVAIDRGFSLGFVEWLHEAKLIGWYQGKIAFPVHDVTGRVIRCHCRDAKGSWLYFPTGMVNAIFPLVIGNPLLAGETWGFESQWDALAVADRMGMHEGRCDAALYVTRGASNGPAVTALKDRLPHDATLIAWPQNDPEEKRSKNSGLTPAESWLKAVRENCNGATVYVAKTPPEYKDANDWTRAGATPRQLSTAIARGKGVLDFYTAADLWKIDTKDDPNCILGDRWLCRGSSCLWIGNAGIGKSTLAMQAAIYWAMNLPLFGIKPKRKLKSLFIQAENDDGDMAEMLRGVVNGICEAKSFVGNQMEMLEALQERLIFTRDMTHTGADFAKLVDRQAGYHRPDFIWIDPLLSFAGDDIMQQKVASDFLRVQLNPVSERHGFSWMVMHHTGKPTRDKDATPLSDSQLQYAGLGSSELQNWARAVNVLLPAGDNLFKLTLSKRGKRAGAVDFEGENTSAIYLKHSEIGLFWEQVPTPGEGEEGGGSRRGAAVTKYTPEQVLERMSLIDGIKVGVLQKDCAEQFGMAKRTFYRTWDSLKVRKKVVERDGLFFVAPTK